MSSDEMLYLKYTEHRSTTSWSLRLFSVGNTEPEYQHFAKASNTLEKQPTFSGLQRRLFLGIKRLTLVSI